MSDTADGTCDADCSLREAVIAANAAVGADDIVVPAGFYLLSRSTPNEDAADMGDLDVLDNLTITGEGREKTIIDGGYALLACA